VFSSHDRYGHRIDLVEFHPAYHELMRTAIEHGLTSLPWAHPQDGAHVARASMTYLHSQAEAGSGCPLTMTFASVPALRLQPDLADNGCRKSSPPNTTRATSAWRTRPASPSAWP
jgi:putative acyl-CoA dehydrogenase